MASQYGIITITQLENYMVRDFSSYVDNSTSPATRLYSDDNIEAWISQAERKVIGYLGKTYDSNAPDLVVGAVLGIAEIIAENRLIKDGIIKNQQIQTTLLTPEIIFDLDQVLPKEKALGRIKGFTNVEDYY